MINVTDGCVGTVILLPSNVPLTNVTLAQIRYKNVSGEFGVWTATASTTALAYTTQSGSISGDGLWELQGYVETTEWKGGSKSIQMKVWEALV